MEGGDHIGPSSLSLVLWMGQGWGEMLALPEEPPLLNQQGFCSPGLTDASPPLAASSALQASNACVSRAASAGSPEGPTELPRLHSRPWDNWSGLSLSPYQPPASSF